MCTQTANHFITIDHLDVTATLIAVITQELDGDWISFGSTTFKGSPDARGTEPDDDFAISNSTLFPFHPSTVLPEFLPQSRFGNAMIRSFRKRVQTNKPQ